MTHDKIALQALLGKTENVDFLRELVEFAAQRLMDHEVESLTNASYDARCNDRTNSRNGYRERPWHTRAGTVDLKVPKLRHGSYFPEFLNPRRCSEKALVAVVQEAFIKGISVRKVDDLVKAMGMEGISKSQVSRLCEEIDERVQNFLTRRLEGKWPFVWLDATYVKVRENSRIVSIAVIVAVGVNEQGRREILGVHCGPSEAEVFWTDFLRQLTDRGLGGVQLVISDAHSGLKAAISKVLKATWQRCRVHFMRNALAHVNKTQQPLVSSLIKTIFAQGTAEEAREQWRKVSDSLRERWPKLADVLDDAEADVLAYMGFDKSLWKQLHSTNSLERLNKEIKRRTRVVGIFPNEAAVIRLVGALMLEQNDEWQLTRRYMSLEILNRICNPETEKKSLPIAAQ